MNRCVSCRHPIASSAEWCCEPCANNRGHADTCRLSAHLRVTERRTDEDGAET